MGRPLRNVSLASRSRYRTRRLMNNKHAINRQWNTQDTAAALLYLISKANKKKTVQHKLIIG